MTDKAFELRHFGGTPCKDCGGLGYLAMYDKCPTCGGSGIKQGTQKRRPENVKRFSF